MSPRKSTLIWRTLASECCKPLGPPNAWMHRITRVLAAGQADRLCMRSRSAAAKYQRQQTSASEDTRISPCLSRGSKLLSRFACHCHCSKSANDGNFAKYKSFSRGLAHCSSLNKAQEYRLKTIFCVAQSPPASINILMLSS